MAEVAAIVILVALLALVIRPPRPWPEVVWAAPAAVLVIVTGLESPGEAWNAVHALLPTLVFLAAILVVGEVAEAAGLFDVAGGRLQEAAHRGPTALLLAVSAIAVAVTTVLSLDATVVLFTPVVLWVVRGRADRNTTLLATVFLANGASLLLPVANLTNLLALDQLGLSFPAFAAHMALPTVVSTVVIVAACRWLASPAVVAAPPAGSDGAVPTTERRRAQMTHTGRVVGAGIGVLLVALVLASLDGIEAGWVAAIGAGLLGGYALTRGLARPKRLVRAASFEFVGFVACLQIVVDAARRHGLGDAVADRLPGGQGLGTLLAVAALAAVLANLVNNLPATLILLPTLAGRPVAVVLAMLIGVNVGPNLTYTGSLATLLWRKVVRADRSEPATGAYYRVTLLATPAALIAATVALWVSVLAIG